MRTVARRGIARIGANDSQIGPRRGPAWQGPRTVVPGDRTPTSGGARRSSGAATPDRRMELGSEAAGFAGAKPMAGLAERAIRQRREPSAQPRRRRACRSDVELCLEYLVDALWVRLAPGRLHHLAYEPSDHRGLRFRLFSLVGIAGNDLIDELFDRRRVGQLL
jgi:hypothetical protein